MGVRGHLLRGVVAGLVAGLVVGVLAFVVAEPVIDRAVALEMRFAAPAPEVFSRRTQHLGLIVATTLFGLALGGILALAYLATARRAAPGTVWRRSLGLAAAMLTGVYLVPFLRYPANPPGVGDPSTIDRRTAGYTLAIAIGTLAVWGAWRSAGYLRARGVGEPVRHTVATLCILAAIAAEFLLLPESTDGVRVPAGLLWDFRIRALGTQLLLWAGTAALFAVLTERAIRRSAPPRQPGRRPRFRLRSDNAD